MHFRRCVRMPVKVEEPHPITWMLQRRIMKDAAILHGLRKRLAEQAEGR